jgi:hypothetical protein
MLKLRFILAFIVLSTMTGLFVIQHTAPVYASGIIFVDGSASGGNNGSSWENAYTNLQTAINSASDGGEIWVAKGIYYVPNGTSGFGVTKNVSLFGGFSGTETSISQRNIENNETILSAKVSGITSGEHVFSINGAANQHVVIDGFTIQDAVAGGIDVYAKTSMTLRNSIVKNNKADSGGGISYYRTGTGDSVTRTNYIENVTFYKNEATRYNGGAVEVYSDTIKWGTLIIKNSKFIGNKSAQRGSAIYLKGLKSQMQASNTVFSSNVTGTDGVIWLESFNQTMPFSINNTFANNSGSYPIYFQTSYAYTLKVQNTLFYNGMAPYPTSKMIFYYSSTYLSGSISGTSVTNENPLFLNVNGEDGILGTIDDDYSLSPTSPVINTGNNGYVSAFPTDITGLPRVNDGVVDRGAYEFYSGLPVLSMVDTNSSVNENDGEVLISVVLDEISNTEVTVNYSTVNDTAEDGVDFSGGSGSITFAPGETEKTISIPIIDNPYYEANKQFQVLLSDPINATLDNDSTTVTIVNDEDPLSIGFLSFTYSYNESERAIINVNLNNPSRTNIYVNYATAGDTAIAGQDYTDVSGTLLFTPGQTSKSFAVPVINNGVVDNDRTVHLILSAPVGAPLRDGADMSTLTILNDDTDVSYSNVVTAPTAGGERLNLAWTLVTGQFSASIGGSTKEQVQFEVRKVEDPVNESVPQPANFQIADTLFEVDLVDPETDEKVPFSEATLCFPYTDEQVLAIGVEESELNLLHYENDRWVNITTFVDVDQNQICGVANSFSPFAIVGNQIMGLNASVTVQGAPLSVVTSDVTFDALELSGSSQVSDGSPASAWEAVDPTGTGAGL